MEVVVNERAASSKQTCTDVQRKKVESEINAYLNSLRKPS